jgi:hypothetical protein
MENPLDQIIPILKITPARWTAMVQAIPGDLITLSPAAGEWSALECLQHLIDTERIFQTRIQAFLEGRDFPGFNPDEEGTQMPPSTKPVELADEFSKLREKSLASLAKLAGQDLNRKARHAELGPVTFDQMVNEWAAHDLNHTMQAEGALMQPFIKRCGPWQIYFQDHMVKEK